MTPAISLNILMSLSYQIHRKSLSSDIAEIFLNAMIPSQEKLTPYYMETMHINNLRKGLVQVSSKQNLS